MAVTKIRKISSWVLVVCSIIMLVLIGLFFGGGDNEPYNGQWNPKYTDILLYWMYILFGITLAAMLFFALVQFANNFRADAKKALTGLAVIVFFALLFFATYSIGDGTPMSALAKPDIEAYNTPVWLKVADMFLYSIYVMASLTILGIIIGSVKKFFAK
jgi:ABC-type multidrug transport system fused ATPase/permease subunit